MTDPPRRWYRPRFDGLALRVAAFLTIALLPLGLIALWQTREFHHETQRRAELTLLALTEQGAAGVGAAIERALGAGEALSAIADMIDDSEACSRYLARFVIGDNPFDFVGLLPLEGPVTCSSRGKPFDLDASARAEMVARLASGGDTIQASRTRENVIVFGLPVRTEGESGFSGLLVLTVPHDRIAAAPPRPPRLTPLRLVTFNADGDVLTGAQAAEGSPPLAEFLPQGLALSDSASEQPRLFLAPSAGGTERVYTVTPMVPGVAYALGIWTREQAGRGLSGIGDSPLLFPLLMWAVTLVVAFWSIHRLVIRFVIELAQRMRRFGRDRSLPDRLANHSTPYELHEIEDAFRTMAGSILQDEARMENAFRERGVLLREVHHRVKNNLQLISSIISMQARRMPEPKSRATLRRLQDRVLTLAAIYRSLYTSPDLGEVNAAFVLRGIIEQELRNSADRIEATLDIEDMALDPDKVVPLSFLAAEAVSNALARAGAAEGRPSLSVTLHRDGDKATLRIANSLSGPPAPEEGAQGLGQHLIQAFGAQIGGPAEIEVQDRLYILSVTFPTASHHAPAETA